MILRARERGALLYLLFAEEEEAGESEREDEYS